MGRAVRVFSLLTLISRFGGLLRDVLTARIFGDTAVGSAFMAAFAIPNLFRRLLGEGALAAAFLPIYTRLDRDDPEKAHRFASIIVQRLAITTGVITLLVEAGLLAALLAGSDDPDRTLSIRLIMVMFPFMPTVCTAAILGGMLQTHGRFAPSAGMPILLNVFTIIAAIPYVLTDHPNPVQAAYVLGAATILSGIAQVAWGVLALRGLVRWNLRDDGVRTHVRDMMRQFIPVVIGMGTLQINTFLDTLIAMWPNWVGPTIMGHPYPLDERSNSILSYTQRLYQFPLGVFGVAVATAIFPMLARATDDAEGFGATLRRGLRLSLFIGLPASVGLVIVREDLTHVVYAGGDNGFSREGVVRAGAVLAGFAPAIWAFSINQVWTRAFYASGRMKTPMTVAMLMVGLNAALNMALIWPLREAGLAWSTSICALIQCAILGFLTRRMLGVRPIDRETVLACLRLVAISAIMGGLVLLARRLTPAGEAWNGRFVLLAVSAGVGMVSYFALALLTRSPELRWVMHRR